MKQLQRQYGENAELIGKYDQKVSFSPKPWYERKIPTVTLVGTLWFEAKQNKMFLTNKFKIWIYADSKPCFLLSPNRRRQRAASHKGYEDEADANQAFRIQNC